MAKDKDKSEEDKLLTTADEGVIPNDPKDAVGSSEASIIKEKSSKKIVKNEDSVDNTASHVDPVMKAAINFLAKNLMAPADLEDFFILFPSLR